MVRRVIEEGWSVAAVATAFEVNTRTVRKWLARFRSEGSRGLHNRSSAPHLVANKLAAPWLAMVTRLRRDYRMTGEEVALHLHLSRSTVPGHLARLGLGRLSQLERREPARRYNRARAGELVHASLAARSPIAWLQGSGLPFPHSFDIAIVFPNKAKGSTCKGFTHRIFCAGTVRPL
jgi:transposase-like protein